MHSPVVLGVESSCDETGIGIVSEGELIGEALASSAPEHARFGGVVPEIAARAHLEAVVPTIERSLDAAGLSLGDITHVAATSGPGLATAVHVGLASAKALAWALDVPLYGVHHLAGHAAADTLDHGPLPERSMVLIVSGGHTSILKVGDLAVDRIEHLGDTLDDAAGEAFDKVARLLGLGYPGGPVIGRVAVDGDPTAFDFPRALRGGGEHAFAFSFSGLKTAVARQVERLQFLGAGPDDLPVADLAASFQEAVVDVLLMKALKACKLHKISTLVIVGGVAANARLREAAQVRCDRAGIELRVPRPSLCTDNGAMIAAIGDLLVRAGGRANTLALSPDPSAVLHQSQLPALV
ncbi:tRNA (adenosine(37)-N6)-threonylcarbamoyltransferase complex transferase subunit TsaD [Micrococcales bacterium 31B]|nr:tRNA (adenosine(37)-N6)-threonylcarbamoyltransferase complex transferase subunit TsaD [Micrococcales bacterium 31B]